MNETTNVVRLRQPDAIDDPLTDILRAGARKLLAQAIEIEAEAFLASMRELKLPDGRDAPGPARPWPRAQDPDRHRSGGGQPGQDPRPRRHGRCDRIRFTSAILPKWARRTKSLDALLPVLYLRGLSTGDFQEALAALLGQGRPEPVAVGDHPAHRRMAGRVRALAGARPLGPPLRLCLGRRRLPPGPDGGSGRMHAGADRRHAGGQEGTRRLPGWGARERPELARTARRDQAAGA